MSSQPPPPPQSSKNLLFCTAEYFDQGVTQQSFATISFRNMLQLREQSNVTWNDVCEKATIRHFPSEPLSDKAENNECSNSETTADAEIPTEINKLEDDQVLEANWPEHTSKLEQEIAGLKDENKRLYLENMQILSFVGELGTCFGITWNIDNGEGYIQKETLCESNLQTYFDRIKQVLQKGKEDKLELEKLKEMKHLAAFDDKTMIDRDSQTDEKSNKTLPNQINPPNIRRRKKGVCKVLGTNLQEYWCSCGRTFAHRDRIAVHIKINKLSWKFKCTECPLKFADLKTLKAHTETTHKIKNPFEDYKRGCIFCGKMFALAEELTQHTENHKKEWVKNPKAVKMIKTINPGATPNLSLGDKRKKIKKMRQALAVEPIKLTTNRKRTLFKCRLCTRTFSDHVRFQRHTVQEHKHEEV